MAMGAVEDSDDSSVGSDADGEAITSVDTTINDDSVPEQSRPGLLSIEIDAFQQLLGLGDRYSISVFSTFLFLQPKKPSRDLA